MADRWNGPQRPSKLEPGRHPLKVSSLDRNRLWIGREQCGVLKGLPAPLPLLLIPAPLPPPYRTPSPPARCRHQVRTIRRNDCSQLAKGYYGSASSKHNLRARGGPIKHARRGQSARNAAPDARAKQQLWKCLARTDKQARPARRGRQNSLCLSCLVAFQPKRPEDIQMVSPPLGHGHTLVPIFAARICPPNLISLKVGKLPFDRVWIPFTCLI